MAHSTVVSSSMKRSCVIMGFRSSELHLASSQARRNVGTGLRRGCAPCHLLCLREFMHRISKNAAEAWTPSSWMTLKVASLLFADDVVILALSDRHLRCAPQRFYSSRWHAGRMRISPWKSEACGCHIWERWITQCRSEGSSCAPLTPTSHPKETFKYLWVRLICFGACGFCASVWFVFVTLSSQASRDIITQKASSTFSAVFLWQRVLDRNEHFLLQYL